MSTLYRDYRPQNFQDILGQKHIKITLQNEISTNHLAQAFLFCGPRAVGKTTMARVLAKSVNCLNRKEGEYEPCGECANCIGITSGKHLDIIEIDAASNTGVDNVRENIISFSRLAPSSAKYKVFIIDEVHMLSTSAFNALLKIIEEPPKYVMFILATTEVHKVPYTIISRCERYDFRRIGISDIVSKLELIAKHEKKEVEPEVLEGIARRSGGHLRDAESLLGQIFSLGKNKISLKEAELLMPHYNNNEVITLLSHLANKDAAKALEMINSLADAGVSIKNFIAETVFMLRKMAISKISPQLSDNLGLNLGDSLEIKINELSSNLKLNQILYYIKRLLLALSEKNQLILQLPLELAAIEICSQDFLTDSSLAKPRVNISSKPNPEKVISKPSITVAKLDDKKEETNLKTVSGSGQVKSDINLSCEQINEKWPEFLIKIKKYNHSLSFVLQNCEPRELKSGTLHLVFKYKFHQDRVNDMSIKKLIESTLSEVFGGRVMLEAKLNKNIEPEESENNNMEEDSVSELVEEKDQEDINKTTKPNESLMNNLLTAFGGEVIN
ncbi:MAG TPA: DNA polymerase III subunit gamma/tau [Patescibacteria group bacterium]|nr:DNA polymerase III subunit gamma/tau [Patescibacteria group bacterium]